MLSLNKVGSFLRGPDVKSLRLLTAKLSQNGKRFTFSGLRLEDAKDKSESNHFRRAFQIVLGISVGIFLKKFFDDDKSNLSNVGKVCAASFFSKIDHAQDDNVVKGGNKEPPIVGNKRYIYNFIADVVEKVSEGVVYIEVKDKRRMDRFGQQITYSSGSGFLVSEEGLIITNAHVVTTRPRNSKLMVRLHDGREFEAVIEELDVMSDLALIRIQCSGLKPMILGKSDDLRPGEFVIALGSPLSLVNTITSGIVSSVSRPGKELGLRGCEVDFIQTDATITSGNSGGPLVNLDGDVIGINSMTAEPGVSFAIPVDYAKKFIENVKAKGSKASKFDTKGQSSKRRYMGVTILSLTPKILAQLQTARAGQEMVSPDVRFGILIYRVIVGSPAHLAGLKPGDVISHINGHEIHSSRDFYQVLEGRGDLELKVTRNGEWYSLTVAPEE